MLELKDIVKDYETGGEAVHALRGISIKFRDSEFVSILGPSGCGKTTTLNIIGGLDRFNGGDLIINGRSTKDYKDRDWDTYRNHSVGFVFQNYNLIPHQTVLGNVELALTLSGVSKSERQKRAKEALEKVGLGDQLKKKPSQMSGGQMQRVAIARALVNDPEILLADEPTGALDSETSVQIMNILKEISKDRLIIMVTHNPELAENYSTRIVRFMDGKMTSDSNPFDGGYEAKDEDKEKNKEKTKKTTMSFSTALSLSTKNLMTKKGRTFLTSFAGSIGIIGIALILSISNGVQEFIEKVQEDTLSSYPLTIQHETANMNAIMESIMGKQEEITDHPLDKIYSNNIMNSILTSMTNQVQVNNLSDFRDFLEDENNGISQYISSISYTYNVPVNIYKRDTSDGAVQVNPYTGFSEAFGDYYDTSSQMMSSMYGMSGMDVWSEMLDNQELLSSQYDVIAGEWADSYDEVMLVVTENNEITDYALYSLGILEKEELDEIIKDAATGELAFKEREEKAQTSYTYDEILGLRFSLVLPTDYYKYNEENGTWDDMTEDEDYMKELIGNAPEIRIAGIIRPNEEAVASAINGTVGYTKELEEYIINGINDSEIVKAQLENPDVDVFSGLEFPKEGDEEKEYTMDDIKAYVENLPEDQQKQMKQYSMFMDEETMLTMFSQMMPKTSTDATYDGNLEKLSVESLDDPQSISIYAATFADKDEITAAIDAYNDRALNEGREEDKINYTDFVALIMSSVTTIINAISYVLIAFVSISLIVSSIMIGIITYISVLERTKEIGILRSIGASKKDIARVFNAETLIIGFTSGVLGIAVSLGLDVIISIIVKNLVDISNIAILPPVGGAALILISVLLTFIGGLIPSKMAAKKDPVIALRTE